MKKWTIEALLPIEIILWQFEIAAERQKLNFVVIHMYMEIDKYSHM